MKTLISFVLWVMFSNLGICQTTPSTEELVAKVITSGGIDGHTDSALSRAGDAAAVALTKVIAGRTTLGASEVESALAALHLAFSAPQIVESRADRQPRTALFVLDHLGCMTSDDALRTKIEDERRFVLGQFAKLKQP